MSSTNVLVRASPMVQMSAAYQGNRELASNISANIPSEENCSFYLLNLPPDVTTSELLAAIRGIGRVFQTHINLPSGAFWTAAAKVTFFTVWSARRFERHCAENGLVIRRFTAKVIRNRIRVAQSPEPTFCSRVIIVHGPAYLVNVMWLVNFFNEKFVYQLDEAFPLLTSGSGKTEAVVEFRFGSFRSQAQFAKMAIDRELVDLGVRVFYGKDPCDVGAPQYSAFGSYLSISEGRL